jgi:hypothetical protein
MYEKSPRKSAHRLGQFGQHAADARAGDIDKGAVLDAAEPGVKENRPPSGQDRENGRL